MPKDQLFAAQIELLMRSLATDTVLAHAAGLAVALLLLWNVVDSELLLPWVAVLMAILLLRSGHMHYCLNERLHRINARRVCWQMLAGIAQADVALYAAKAEGRNTIKSA